MADRSLPKLHPHTGLLLEPLGYRANGMPIWPILGASEEDDSNIDPTGGNGDPEDDDDEDDSDEGEYKPPTKEEWQRTQAALKKANAEAKTHRIKAKQLASKSTSADTDAAQKAADAAEARFKPIAIRSAAKAAFMAAGLNATGNQQIGRLVKMLDMDDVDIDDDGDVLGLDEQIEDIKKDFPAMFRAAPQKKAGRLDAGGRSSGGGNESKTTGEKIAAQVFGK